MIYSVGSIDAPGSGEPYTVNRTLGAGKTVIFRSNSGATSGTILTTKALYGDTAYDKDGVRLSTNAGTIEKRCAAQVYPSQLYGVGLLQYFARKDHDQERRPGAGEALLDPDLLSSRSPPSRSGSTRR